MRGTKEPLLVMECMANGSLWGLLHNQSFVFETDLALPILRDIMQVPPAGCSLRRARSFLLSMQVPPAPAPSFPLS